MPSVYPLHTYRGLHACLNGEYLLTFNRVTCVCDRMLLCLYLLCLVCYINDNLYVIDIKTKLENTRECAKRNSCHIMPTPEAIRWFS